MLTGIDHVIVAVRDPDEAAAEIERTLGLRAAGGGRHEAHGTHNRLIWLGDSYIELMGVFDESLARESWWGRQALERLGRGDAGHVGLALASDDVAADAARLREAGSAIRPPEAGSRSRPDGRVVRWRLAHADRPDPELGLVFLIEHDPTSAEWTPAERASRAREEHPLGGPVSLERIELPVADVRATTMRLHRDVGVAFRPSLAGGGARDGAIGRQTLRLLHRAPGLRPRIGLRGGRPERSLPLLGYDWLIEPG